MLNMSLTDFRLAIKDLLPQIQDGERVILEKHGKPVAAVVPIEDLELIQKVENAYDLEMAKKAKESDPEVAELLKEENLSETD